MSITTPQPEYVNTTQEVVEEALEPDSGTEHFKLVPTPADWMAANRDSDPDMIQCPLCFSSIRFMAIDSHTAWHQKLLDIVLLLAR